MQHGGASISADQLAQDAIAAWAVLYPAVEPAEEKPAAPVNADGGYLSDSRLPYGKIAIDPEIILGWVAQAAGLTPSGLDKLRVSMQTGIMPIWEDGDASPIINSQVLPNATAAFAVTETAKEATL